MHLSVYLPLLFGAVFGLSAPRCARCLPPAAATWLLSIGGLFAAVASMASLALLGFTFAGQIPFLAARGHWSPSTLRHGDPVWTPIAVAAVVVLAVLFVRALRVAVRQVIALRDAHRLAASLLPVSGELAVIDDADKHAYAVPGRPGRIVVTTGLLRTLGPAERRAVLAHERSHLTHLHCLHHAAANIAAAANPLLRQIPAAVALSTERWADEDAATACHRTIVATALARSAVGGPRMRTLGAVLGVVVTDVAARVDALRLPPPRLTIWRVGVLIGLLAASGGAMLEAASDLHRLFELAKDAYRVGRT